MGKLDEQALAYAQGICKAAEAAGVDPRMITRGTIAKTAMEKRAFTAVELAVTLGLMAPTMYGAFKGINAIGRRNQASQAAARAAEVGQPQAAGPYSAMNRRMENIGKYTSTGLAATLGALKAGRGARGKGAIAGGLAGLVANLAGGGFGRTTAGGARTGAQQAAYDSSSHMFGNLLLPGVAGYNARRRPGAAQ